jgi:long-chain acyl-CoA synthetase
VDIWSRFLGVSAVRPHHPALIHGDTNLSFAQLRAAATRAAIEMHAAGVGQGDRCVVWSENAPGMAATLLGLLALGAIPTMVNAEAPVSHYHHALRKVGARHAVADSARLGTGGFDRAGMEGTVLPIASIEPDGEVDPTLPPRAVAASEPATIVFTSGSTGLPKGVAQSHANLIWGCEAVARSIALRTDDRILCPVPWAFDYGWGQLLSSVLLGVTQILPVGKLAVALCEAIERHRPTVLAAIPQVLAGLVAPARQIDRSSLRLLTNTGSAIPPDLFATVLETFPDLDISLNYGMTETYRSASLPPSLARSKPRSVGRGIPGVDLVILREDGTVAAAGETGEIVHRGGGVFLGYWGDPQRTLERRRPDPLWPHPVDAPMVVFTGDLGSRDDDGHLYFLGRRDRQMKPLGVRVSPDEIEGLVAGSALVAEVAVVSRPHEIMGDMVIAFVTPARSGDDPLAALKAFARSTMSPFMRPMEWRLVPMLPRTANGKIDYGALKRMVTPETARA